MILVSHIAQILQTRKDSLKHHSKIPDLGDPLLARWLDVPTWARIADFANGSNIQGICKAAKSA